jgi:TonB-linked SusC/RagA family outer membrane protein
MRFTYTDQIFDPVKLFFSVSDNFEDRINANETNHLSIIQAALGWPPSLPVIDPETGDYFRNQAYGTLAPNPVFTINERNNRTLRNNFLTNAYLEFDLHKNLKFKTQGNVRIIGLSTTSFNRVSPNQVVNDPDNSSYGNTSRMILDWQARQQLTYSKEFGRHDLNVTGVYEVLSSQERDFGAGGSGLSTQDLDIFSAPVATFQSNNSGRSNRDLRSLFSRVNYTLDEKYLFTFNTRYDASSQLGDGYEGDTFFGGAFAYRLSEVPFFQSIKNIDEVKLRLSAGEVGSQAVGFAETLETIRYNTGYSFDGTSFNRGAIIPAPSNPRLTWEKTTQFDVGVDMVMWKGRASVTLDAFHKRTTGLIFSRPVPSYLGGGNVKVNSGEMENKGIELAISGISVDKKDFTIESAFNFSVLRNKLIDIIGNSDFIISGLNPRDEPDLQDNSHRNFVNQPLGLLWGLRYAGVYGLDEESEAALYNRNPGDAKYIDLNEDGIINNDDMTVIGNPNPDFTWGFTTTANYKNWTLNMVWNGVHGLDVFNSVKYNTYFGARDATNRDILNRWTPDNTSSNIPGYTPTSANARQSDQWIEDGSFIKLRNITLRYSVPVKKISWLKSFKSLSAYISAQNAIVLTEYSGFDPESLSNVGDRAGGFDDGGYPIPRTFILGLDLGF